MKKLIEGFKVNRKMLITCAVISLVVASMSMSAFAAVPDVQTVLTTSFQGMVSDIMATAAAILPICLGIMGLTVSVGFAVKWFKKLTGQSI